MAHGMKTTFFGLLLIAFNLVYTSNAFCAQLIWGLHITNGIDSSPIVINPKSEDGDDQGIQILNPNDTFSWEICEKVKGSTTYHSTFFWNPRLTNLTVFDDNIRVKCARFRGKEDCYWMVKEDGFYRSPWNNPFPDGWVKTYDWPS